MRSSLLNCPLGLLLACARVGDGDPQPQPESDPLPPGPALIEQEPAEPESGPEPEPAPEPATGFEPATRGSGACIVSVVALLEAEEYRGAGPITPALEASLAANPDSADRWESESHGDHHIQCHYAVELKHLPGKRFSWRLVLGNTSRDHTPETCKGRAAEVADDIVSTTERCTDLDAGAYWGHVLEPLAQP
jgi:hypothetical protein